MRRSGSIPSDAIAFNNRGIAYHDKGDNDRAIADYDEAIRLDPKFARAFINRGNAYRDKGDNDRAIADYNEAIRLDPKYAMALQQSRQRLRATRATTTAPSPTYSEAIRLDPNPPWPTGTAVTSDSAPEATTTVLLPITAKRSGSIRGTWRLISTVH